MKERVNCEYATNCVYAKENCLPEKCSIVIGYDTLEYTHSLGSKEVEELHAKLTKRARLCLKS